MTQSFDPRTVLEALLPLARAAGAAIMDIYATDFEVRGKSDARGGSFPGTAERPLERKQVFSSALRRVNKQAARLDAADARAAHINASRRALAMRRAAPPKHHPDAGKTADAGMVATSNTKGSTKTAPAKVGSVSQANKNAQAKRDKR